MRVQGQATQTAVWLSILHFYGALLSILLEINFLQDSRGTQLSIYFMKAQPCTLVLPVAGRWTEQVSHSLTAHPVETQGVISPFMPRFTQNGALSHTHKALTLLF